MPIRPLDMQVNISQTENVNRLQETDRVRGEGTQHYAKNQESVEDHKKKQVEGTKERTLDRLKDQDSRGSSGNSEKRRNKSESDEDSSEKELSGIEETGKGTVIDIKT